MVVEVEGFDKYVIEVVNKVREVVNDYKFFLKWMIEGVKGRLFGKSVFL